uniref:Similarity n=1 Tax=Strongyloides venezuelensis TaxID=75913 RepID=A0A0K0FY76_STRVS
MPGGQTYDSRPQVNVVRTQSMTTYNTPNAGYSQRNYGPSPRENFNPHYSRYYQNRGFNYGQYGPNRYGSHSYLPYRGYTMVDPNDRAVMGLGLLASSLIGKKHA